MSVLTFARPIQIHSDQPSERVRLFEKDITDLLTFKRHGHMEKWEYWEADFRGDPAGGDQFWESLIQNPGPYYIPVADQNMILHARHHSGVDATLRDIHTVVELGPGSRESVERKTLPFLHYAKSYIAIDLNMHHAQRAAHQVKDALGIPTFARCDHYLSPEIVKAKRAKTGFIMWGVSLGNIEGRAGEDPLPKLVNALSSLANTCNPGDTLFIGIDTEHRREALLNAYNTPLLSQKFLSILHAAKKFGLTSGHFTPETWTHRSVWYDKVGQCAHYLIPGEDQDFTIAGQQVHIPAGKAVITNNSYKFSPTLIEEAARAAGFSRVYISNDRPIALLMATK